MGLSELVCYRAC